MIANNRSGFTLIEVLLAAAITSMIMIGLYQAMGSALSAYDQNRDKQDLLSQAHYALRRMTLFVRATDSITEPDTIESHEILQVSERLLDTYDNTDQTYLDDGDGLIDADNDADNLVNEGCGDDADTVTFSLDKTDADNWKLIEQIPNYATANPADFAATRVISENVTAFACHLVTVNLIEIALTLADGSETVTLKTRAPATHATSYVGPAGDSISPIPDPTTWASPPAATSSCRVAMTATVATDNKTPVQYYFECTAGPGHDSGWQASTLFADNGLASSTAYTYRVKARDQSTGKNETGWSTVEPATTTATEPIEVDLALTSTGGDVTIESWPHTVTGTGSNRILIVGVAYAEHVNKGVQSATYGGQSLSLAGLQGNGSQVASEIWYLINPPTGANMVVVTMKDQVKLRCGAISFLNVDQAPPSFYSISGNSTAPSVSIAGVNEMEVVVDHLAVANDPSASEGPGQTMQWDGVHSTDIRTVGSTEDGPAGGGPVAMSWTLSSKQKWALGAVVLRPACQ